jgi:xylulokinase
MSEHILAYDLGTGGVKVSIFDEQGKSVADNFSPYETSYPQSGYHEQNPWDWWKAVRSSTQELFRRSELAAERIVCLAVSGHSLGVVPIGVDGTLLSEQTPIWSDSRADKEAAKFFEGISQNDWYRTTGNGFPPALYSIFKIMWFKEHRPELYRRTAKFIGTKDYINYLLTGTLCTDYSYASGSGVYDLMAWGYQEDFIANAEVARDKLPDIVSSSEVLGRIRPEVADELGLSENVKVVCGGVDNACMALGAGCIEDGDSYTSLGSSAWIAVSGSEPIVDIDKKPYVFTHCIPEKFVSSAAIFSAGSSFRWLRDTICREYLTEPEPYEVMTALAADSPVGANRLIFNPSLAGGSSLDKSRNIKGAYVGLQLGHTQGDLIRAAMEGVCLNLKIALEVMESYQPFADEMLIVGGGGKSEFWRSLFADIYNKQILATNIGQDAGSLGAAALAAVGVGLWEDFSKVKDLHLVKSRIEPAQERSEKYETILKLFRRIADAQSDIGDWMAETVW